LLAVSTLITDKPFVSSILFFRCRKNEPFSFKVDLGRVKAKKKLRQNLKTVRNKKKKEKSNKNRRKQKD